jgi:hypothetical protein
MQVQTSTTGDNNGYAIGWGISKFRGQRMVAHSGGMPGVSTHLRLFPDAQSAVIAFTNSDQAVALTLITGWLQQALIPEDATASPSKQQSDEEKSEEPLAAPVDLKGNWKGNLVHHDGDLPVEVFVLNDEKIHFRLGNGPLQRLENVNLEGGELRGSIAGRLATQSTYHGNNTIRLHLKPQPDGRLVGTAVAFADGYYALAHWLEVKREAGK